MATVIYPKKSKMFNFKSADGTLCVGDIFASYKSFSDAVAAYCDATFQPMITRSSGIAKNRNTGGIKLICCHGHKARKRVTTGERPCQSTFYRSCHDPVIQGVYF